MGTYRLFLSYMVMLSHAGFIILGHNQGVIAVISFLLLSGYVMTALVDKHYTGRSKLAGFYADRAMRLMPQYLFYSAITAVLAVTSTITPPSLSNITTEGILFNLALLPLNMQYFLDCRFIPPAWSLGMEAQFYLVFPIILLFRARGAVIAISIAIFLAAYVGILNTDVYGYRLLPGTLFIFLLGSLMWRQGSFGIRPIAAIYAMMAALFIALALKPELKVPYNYEVLIGILIGVPLVAVLAKRKSGFMDTFLGNISYGAFLNHQLLIWIFTEYKMNLTNPATLALLVAASTVLACASYYLIEKPVISLRHKLRDKSESKSAQAKQSAA